MEIAGVLCGLLFPGHKTPTLMANGLRELLTHRRTPWLRTIPGAIDEILRFSPSIVTWRRAAKAVETDGVAIPASANVLLLLASAGTGRET